MKWLKALFGGKKKPDRIDSLNLSESDLIQLTRDYLGVQEDEGASGRPTDYELSLTFVPPSPNITGKWPGMPLCGCCSVPFAIDPRKSGLWVAKGARGKQLGTMVPLCAVCITYLNKKYRASDKIDRYPLPKNYDTVGQALCSKFPLDDLKRLAISRIALLRKTRDSQARNQTFNTPKTEHQNLSKGVASESRIDIDYFRKVKTLISVTGRSEEFEALCGWDDEYGKLTARVCEHADLTQENPVVISSLLTESLKLYDQSRDESLDYLTKVANGLKARAENPETAEKLLAEQQEKDNSNVLFKSINIASDSPEANYIRDVDKYILSTGHYEDLVLPAQGDDEFMEASVNVYMAGYETGSSPKVVGALIADGANKYKHNPEFGITFLDSVASRMRKRHSESWGKGTPNVEHENTVNASHPKGTEDIDRRAENYHSQIDEQIEASYKFLRENLGETESQKFAEPYSLKTLAVFVVHIATLVAINREYPGMNRLTFNGFTRTLSFRTPNTMPNTKPPDGMLVSYCSLEESFMHSQTETFLNSGAEPVVRNLLQYLGGERMIDYKLLWEHVLSTSQKASRSYVPFLVEL